jgi:hypothetical protein
MKTPLRIGTFKFHPRRYPEILDADGVPVGREDAVDIVRACNNFDQLLAVCKAAREYLIPDLVEPGRTVFWKLNAVITEAEKEIK